MAWSRTTRDQHKREAMRFESDLIDAEWGLIEPLIPRQGPKSPSLKTFAWLGRCRRLAKDFERTVESSLAWVKLTICRFLMRRVARGLCNRECLEIPSV